MGVNCCSNEKEPPEITINKPENNYSITKKNPNSEKNQQNELIIVNPIQSTQIQGSIISSVSSSNIIHDNFDQNNSNILEKTANLNKIIISDNSKDLSFNQKKILNVFKQNYNYSNIKNNQIKYPKKGKNLIYNNNNIHPNINNMKKINNNKIIHQSGNKGINQQLLQNQNINSNIQSQLEGLNINEFFNNNNNPTNAQLNEVMNIYPLPNTQQIDNNNNIFINELSKPNNLNIDEILKQVENNQPQNYNNYDINIEELLNQNQNNQQQNNYNDLYIKDNNYQRDNQISVNLNQNSEQLYHSMGNQIQNYQNPLYLSQQFPTQSQGNQSSMEQYSQINPNIINLESNNLGHINPLYVSQQFPSNLNLYNNMIY